jgi:hypothetical protein
LTSVLQREVAAVELLLSKKLPVSTVHRLAIAYVDGMKGSLFLKLGRPFTGQSLDMCRPEVEFYLNVAPGIGRPPLIRCYDAAFDVETGRSHVLMEDLTGSHSQPEQQVAPTEKMSRMAVEALGRVHAEYWNSDKLGNDIGTVFDDAWLSNFIENLNKDVADFLKFAELTSRQRLAYDMMLRSAPKIWGRLTERRGLTVTHGDLHWWNFLYPKDVSCDSVRVFDWQLWHIDLGARDLAFLLALGGFAEPRPELEPSLLHAYRDALDVDGYSWDTLNFDYRISSIRNLNIPVIFWKQGKHASTWQTALRRAWTSFERLNCAELL